jgi:excisionase family DNA binding protein
MGRDAPWYDLKTFSEITGLGKTMVAQLRHDGRLQVVRVGRRVFVPAGELERFVEAVTAETSREDES